MFKTFKKAFALKNTYRVNGIIFSLKQIPLIKKLLPAVLYRSRGLKLFAGIVSVILELANIFVTKPVYVALMIYLPATLYQADTAAIVLHIFLLMTLIGVIMNSHLFNPTKDKYYAMFLLKMDPREYALSNYGYFLLKSLLGLGASFIVCGLLVGLRLPTCILMAFFVVFSKICFHSFLLWQSQRTGRKTYNENKPSPRIWIAIFAILLCAYGLPLINLNLSETLFYILMVPVIVFGLAGSVYLWRFQGYRRIYKELLSDNNIFFGYSEAVRQANIDTFQKKQLDSSVKVNSNKSGYGYLHEIFVKRHRKLLTRSARNFSIGIGVFLVAALVMIFISPEVAARANRMMLNSLPLALLIMYFVNRGQYVTQAMFMNCDHSMLTYRFYRQPEAILQLFRQRLRTLVAINLLPAMLIALGLPLVLYLSGGTDNPLNYLMLFLAIISMSVFFSVHHLVMYYLLQPYNVELQSKSVTYAIVNYITYIIPFAFMYIKLPTIAFGSCMVGFAILYVILSLVFAYKYAPKTFKLR
ncbi:hypothetical protein [Emergencia timonensis]|uniref:hypothetical protein n=1 Tax=Emergencia timonensis TaxID=1776384 RepID=UPI003992FBA2